MKKITTILLVFIFSLSLCACSQNEQLTEDSLLYFCGAKTTQDVTKIEFIHEDYQYYHEGKIEITEKEDFDIFKYYKYQSDFPSDRLHELYIFPTNAFTLTVNGKSYSFYLHDDGSLTYIPTGNGESGPKTYTANKNHSITNKQFSKWIIKYDVLK